MSLDKTSDHHQEEWEFYFSYVDHKPGYIFVDWISLWISTELQHFTIFTILFYTIHIQRSFGETSCGKKVVSGNLKKTTSVNIRRIKKHGSSDCYWHINISLNCYCDKYPQY